MHSKNIIQRLPPCIVNIGRDSYARVIGTPAILQCTTLPWCRRVTENAKYTVLK